MGAATGAPSQALATRFYGWVKAGIGDQILAELQRQADAEGELDESLHHVDGSAIRVHRHAAGAYKGSSAGPSACMRAEASGRSQGGFSSAIYLRAEGKGKPRATFSRVQP